MTGRARCGCDGPAEWMDGWEKLLTLLFSPVQWTIAWLCVASPLRTKELLSRDICFSRDSALLKRDARCGDPGREPPSPPAVATAAAAPERASRRFRAPLSQRAGPGSAIQVEAVRRSRQRRATDEGAPLRRRDAMLCAVVALVSVGK